LSAHQARLLETLLPELSLVPERSRDPRSYFSGAVGDAWLEIGFGGGEHLIWQSEAHPDIGMIGAEPYVSGVAKLLSKIERSSGSLRSRSNIRLYMEDARDIIEALPDASLSRVFILFPDPWPKRRHSRRRLVDEGFLAASASALAIGGELWIKTDHADYFQRITKAVDSQKDLFVCVPWSEEYPRTDFEETYRSQNISIYQLRLRKEN